MDDDDDAPHLLSLLGMQEATTPPGAVVQVDVHDAGRDVLAATATLAFAVLEAQDVSACHTPAVDVDEARTLLELYWRRVWHDRELGAVEQFMTDPYVRHSQAGTKVLTHAQVKDELARAWELLHGAVSTVDDVAVAGDRIWGRVTTRGMNLQTGERSVLTWLGSYRLEGGRFAESWNASLPGVDWHE